MSNAKVNRTIFAGIKIYPPLGYKPFDKRFGKKDDKGECNGNRIEAFYKLCNKNKVPILAHCSPGGVVTHDSRKFIELDNKEDELTDFKNAGEITKNGYNTRFARLEFVPKTNILYQKK